MRYRPWDLGAEKEGMGRNEGSQNKVWTLVHFKMMTIIYWQLCPAGKAPLFLLQRLSETAAVQVDGRNMLPSGKGGKLIAVYTPYSHLRQRVTGVSAEIQRQHVTQREFTWRRPTGHPFSDIPLVNSSLPGISPQPDRLSKLLAGILRLIKSTDNDSY